MRVLLYCRTHLIKKCLRHILNHNVRQAFLYHLSISNFQMQTFKRPPKPLPRTRPPRTEKPPGTERPPRPEKPPKPAKPVCLKTHFSIIFITCNCLQLNLLFIILFCLDFRLNLNQLYQICLLKQPSDRFQNQLFAGSQKLKYACLT